MTRALLLALLMIAPAAGASASGAITARLTIFSRCEIGNVGKTAAPMPTIQCGGHFSTQPRVTQQMIAGAVRGQPAKKLMTIEW